MTFRPASLATLCVLLAGCPSATTASGDAGADAASVVDTGGGADAGTDAGTTGSDAGPANGVECVGTANCAVGQVCCGGSTAIVCQSATAPCDGPVLACDGTEDCPGAVCCQTIGTACAATCTGGVRICHADSECNTGERCCPNGGGVPQGALEHCLALAAGTPCPAPP